TLTFSPTSAGAKRASLTLTHNATGSPATLALSGAGRAAATPALRVSVGTARSGRSGTANIPISVSDARGIAGGDLTLTYDATALTAVNVVVEKLVQDASITMALNLDTAGQVKASLAGANAIASGSGALLTVVFEVKPTAKAGTVTLQLTGSLKDQNGRGLPATVSTGSVVISVAGAAAGLLGDVNGDKVVDAGDAILVLRHAAGLATLSTAQRDLGDVNGDGATDTGDAILILRKAAGRLARFPREGVARLATGLPIFDPGAMVLRRGSEGEIALELGPEVWGAALILSHDPETRLIQTSPPAGTLLSDNPVRPGELQLVLAKAEEGPAVLRFRLEGPAQTLRVEGRLYSDQGQAISVTRTLALPTATALGNYPNPFNPATTLRYQLAEAGPVRLAIYNATGTQVRLLVSQPQAAGVYEVVWDGRDEQGRNAASGLYLGRLETGTTQQTQKLLLLK
ncbi:MAG: T9SS type A sorting domain-containing protein, partial [Candidatus Latescibacteria bacterium]|nr:T9SS type A sorting domain-containing protein [Candidatus Latescibacterota bacterium]